MRLCVLFVLVCCGVNAYGADDAEPPPDTADRGGVPDAWWAKGSNVFSQSYSGKVTYIAPSEKGDPEIVGRIELTGKKQAYSLRGTTQEIRDMIKKLDGKQVALNGDLKDGIITVFRSEGNVSGVGKPVKKRGGL